jgi:N-formylglutamate amidohydrolase
MPMTESEWRRAAVELARGEGWELRVGDGPVLATAIHAGHAMRPSLQKWMAVDDAGRRREEDPLTNLWTGAADHVLHVARSRFEVDLNRPRERALVTEPAATWNLRLWEGAPPPVETARSLASHDAFYNLARSFVDRLLARWGEVLVLDLHSYNHRRDGADAEGGPVEANPDLDLGVTTLDPRVWSDLVERFSEALRRPAPDGRCFDVRSNVRYPDGGHFPEWLYATYRDRVCAITIEVKKFYMDEWAGTADLAAVEAVRACIAGAVAAVRSRWAART